MFVLYNKETGEFYRVNDEVFKSPFKITTFKKGFKCEELTEELNELIYNQNLNKNDED